MKIVKVIIACGDLDGAEFEATEEIPVSIEGENLYRLLEQPAFEDALNWGDLIEANQVSEGKLSLVKIIEHAAHTHEVYLLSSGIDVGRDPAMRRLMKDGGFWQQDFNGMLHVFYPPGKTEADY